MHPYPTASGGAADRGYPYLRMMAPESRYPNPPLGIRRSSAAAGAAQPQPSFGTAMAHVASRHAAKERGERGLEGRCVEAQQALALPWQVAARQRSVHTRPGGQRRGTVRPRVDAIFPVDDAVEEPAGVAGGALCRALGGVQQYKEAQPERRFTRAA